MAVIADDAVSARSRFLGPGRLGWTKQLAQAARTPRGRAGLVLAGAVILLAVVGPFVAPYSDTALVSAPFATPSGSHILGGDVLGRDVLSRLLNGGWLLLLMALAATLLGVVVGGAAGIVAGYVGGRADPVIMRTVDVILAFPAMVFALLLVSIAGPQIGLIIIAVGLTHAPQVARVLRSATLDVSEREFVKAAELDGLSPLAMITHEIVPNLVSPLMVEIGLRLTWSIITLAALSFLGFGLQPPSPNWGQMINENRLGIEVNAWATLAPVIVIVLLTVGVNMFADAFARVMIGVDRRAIVQAAPDAPPVLPSL